jgi:hypothetical protein
MHVPGDEAQALVPVRAVDSIQQLEESSPRPIGGPLPAINAPPHAHHALLRIRMPSRKNMSFDGVPLRIAYGFRAA